MHRNRTRGLNVAVIALQHTLIECIYRNFGPLYSIFDELFRDLICIMDFNWLQAECNSSNWDAIFRSVCKWQK